MDCCVKIKGNPGSLKGVSLTHKKGNPNMGGFYESGIKEGVFSIGPKEVSEGKSK